MEVSWTDDQYFADKEHISNSGLGLIAKSPLFFQKVWNGDFEKKQSLSLDRGSLLHKAILEPDKFIVSDVKLVEGKLGECIKALAGGLTQEQALKAAGFSEKYMPTAIKNLEKDDAKAYLEFLNNSNGKIALSVDDKAIIDGCIASLQNDEYISSMLFDRQGAFDRESFNELVVLFEWEVLVPEYGMIRVKCKCKIDRLIIDHFNKVIYNIDLKTTSKGVHDRLIRLHHTGNPRIDYVGNGFLQSYIGYRYYRQQAFYEMGILTNIILPKGYQDYRLESLVIAVETNAPFETECYTADQNLMLEGTREAMDLLARYAYHTNKNDWSKPLESLVKKQDLGVTGPVGMFESTYHAAGIIYHKEKLTN